MHFSSISLSSIFLGILVVVFGFKFSGISGSLSNNNNFSNGCLGSIVSYNLTLKTFWSNETSRHYPGFGYRPSAQWSRVVGRTHNSSFLLFRIGGIASEALKTFVETSSTQPLDNMSEDEELGLHHKFKGPLITSGQGESHTNFFMDGAHSQVSIVARIVPSPDWFVGVDSVNLCSQGEWVESLVIGLDPLDAGTDNGYTFSSPNWRTIPQEAIYNIQTSKLHPAHSFYRSRGKLLQQGGKRPKPLAALTITRRRDDNTNEQDLNNPTSSSSSATTIVNNNSDSNENYERRRTRKRGRRVRANHPNTQSQSPSNSSCVVSPWSAWSECSALCGTGEEKRSRYITKGTDGTKCPPLSETRLCTASEECRDTYFHWRK